MEEKIEKLEAEIATIKKRNAKVELDKAWETSIIRRLVVALITYLLIVIYMIYLKVSQPWLNALVPTIGFILSTLIIGWAKNIWMRGR